MARNTSSGRVDGHLVQAGSIRGNVVIDARRRVRWNAPVVLAAVVLLVVVSAVLWGPESVRFVRVSGLPRAASVSITGESAQTSEPVQPSRGNESAKALAPLDITALEVPRADCKTGWVVPDTGAKSIPMPVTDPAFRPPNAVLSHGGQVKVTVQGRHGVAVALTSIRVEVVARRPAMRGVLLPSPCGSNGEPRYFSVDLSKRAPRAVPEPGRDGGDVIPPVNFPYNVSNVDLENLVFTVASPGEDVEWRLHVLWSSGGETGEVPIDNRGKPFRTTSTANTTKFCFYFGNGSYTDWVAPGTTGGHC